MNSITGLEYYRRKHRWSRFELWRRSGVRRESIEDYEAGASLERCRMHTALRLADALGITVDQLLEIHTQDELEVCDKNYRPSEMHDPDNVLTVYRKVHNYTIREFGKILGITGWGASKLCRTPVAKEIYVRKLADLEGMSLEEFYETYRLEKEDTE